MAPNGWAASVSMVHDAVVIETTDTGLPEWLTTVAGPVVRAEQLRAWGLSEVWRVRLEDPAPRTVIVKRGSGEMAGEARRYRELVIPLALPAPRLLTASGGADAAPAVLVLQDAGPDTLEQRPSGEGYREAVRMLARMRAGAARRLREDPGIGTGLRRSTADFVDAARRAAAGVAALRPGLAGELDGPVRVLTERLGRLAGVPETIVHGDFHAKNLLHAPDNRLVAVDWPLAYVHAHLGDLYCLLREAGKRGLPGAAGLPEVFARAAGADPRAVTDQLVTGGLCWTVLALRWLVEEGLAAIPESRAWLDELVADCRTLADS